MAATSAQRLAVRAYVCAAMPDCSVGSVTVIERLASGENHVVYRCSYLDRKGDTRDVVVRGGSGDDAERTRAHREAAVMHKVGGVAGPEIYDFRPAWPGFPGPVACMQFVPGQQRELNSAHERDMQHLGGVVRGLHALSVEGLVELGPRDASFSGYAEERWRAHLDSRLQSIRDPLPPVLQQRLRAAVGLVSDAIEQLTAHTDAGTNEELVLLHADISGSNVIWAPHPVLIDWEYARFGDPADEVAYLFTQNDLNQSQRAAFWRGYGHAMTASTLGDLMDRVRRWEPMTLLGSIMWWIDAWSRAEAALPVTSGSLPRTADYYLLQALDRLDRFDRMFLQA